MKLSHLFEERKIGFNTLLAQLFGVSEDDTFQLRSQFHEAQIPWLNNNSEIAVNRMIKREDFVLLSKALFYKDHHPSKNTNYFDKVHIKDKFVEALQDPIKLWRGGGGKYDPDFTFGKKKRSWHAFTATEDRAKTFSVYDGTVGKQFLDKRKGPYWIIEVTCKLDDILLYLHQGTDDEVILSDKLARTAKVIVQT
jgi:hypothetical protein